MARKLAKRGRQPAFGPPKYDARSGDSLIWEMSQQQLMSWLEAYDIEKAFAVAETLGVPFAVFWSWWDAVAFVAGKQIIERKGTPVWYVSPEAAERAQEEDAESLGEYAQWMPYFHDQYVPPWFHQFLPPVPPPGGVRENPSFRGPRPRTAPRPRPRAGRRSCAQGARQRPRPNPTNPVPAGVYYAYEIEPCGCLGQQCNQVGPRIAVDFNYEPLALFGMGQNSDEIEFDRDALWEEASLFIAAHQLFTRNVRPVWVGRMQWPEVPPMPDPHSPEYDEWATRIDEGEYVFPIGEYPPFLYEGFHVTYYPFVISAALELPSPPLPPGQLPPPVPTIVAERAARADQQRAELAASAQAGAFGAGYEQAAAQLPAQPAQRGRRAR